MSEFMTVSAFAVDCCMARYRHCNRVDQPMLWSIGVGAPACVRYSIFEPTYHITNLTSPNPISTGPVSSELSCGCEATQFAAAATNQSAVGRAALVRADIIQ